MRIVIAAAAACLVASMAQATPIIRNYAFTATGFNFNAPYSSVSGTFSIAFDNAATFTAPRTTDLGTPTLDVAVLNGIGSPAYTYTTTGDQLSVGSKMINGGCYPFIDTSWCIRISNVSTATPTATFYYIIGNYNGQSGGAMFNSGPVTITEVAASVPEPASWAMMIAGFGLIGVGLRRRPVAAIA